MKDDLDLIEIVKVLNRNGVDYVVIGAYAAIAQQAPIPATRDVDLTPSASPENLERLSTALYELDARIRVEGDERGLHFHHDGESLGRATVWNLTCPFGEFDRAFSPSAFEGGYEQLIGNAHRVDVGGTVLAVADLRDVIASKEAAGRPKDLQVLPILYRFLAAGRS